MAALSVLLKRDPIHHAERVLAKLKGDMDVYLKYGSVSRIEKDKEAARERARRIIQLYWIIESQLKQINQDVPYGQII